MCSILSLSSFLSVAFWNSSNVGLIDNGPVLSFQGRSLTAAYLYAFLLRATDGNVMSLVLCLQVVSQAPQTITELIQILSRLVASATNLSQLTTVNSREKHDRRCKSNCNVFAWKQCDVSQFLENALCLSLFDTCWSYCCNEVKAVTASDV